MSGKANKKRSFGALPPSEAHHKRPKVVVDISEDVLGIVMEFLSPKQLYRMALITCKARRSKIATKLVTRSAIMHGGSPRATVKELYGLIQYGTIHVPSPLRLLRLCNGKRCESCNNKSVRHANTGLGTFLCNKCLTKGPDSIAVRVSISASMALRSYNDIVNDDRLAGRYGERPAHRAVGFFNAILRKPMTQLGEQCGPRFTYRDLERIETSNEPVVEMLDEVFTNTPQQQDSREFIETYEASVEEASAAEEYRKATKEAASKKAAEARLANALKVVSKVQELLQEPWKDFVLANEETGHKGKGGACLKFNSPLCDELLKQYMTAPSKVKKSIVTEIAEKINSFCQKITELLCGWSFLSDDDSFEKALKLSCQEKFPDLKSLVLHERAATRFMAFLKENDSFAALSHLFESNFWFLLEYDVWIYAVRGAWAAGYKQHEAEPCKWTRKRKTFATCMAWQASLHDYLEYLEVHARKEGKTPHASISPMWRIVVDAAKRKLLLNREYEQLMKQNVGIAEINLD